jgi:hypothetical protein
MKESFEFSSNSTGYKKCVFCVDFVLHAPTSNVAIEIMHETDSKTSKVT